MPFYTHQMAKSYQLPMSVKPRDSSVAAAGSAGWCSCLGSRSTGSGKGAHSTQPGAPTSACAPVTEGPCLYVDSAPVEWGLGVCISNKLPCGVHAAGPRTTYEGQGPRETLAKMHRDARI